MGSASLRAQRHESAVDTSHAQREEQRKLDQLDAAQAIAASATVKMRMDAKSLALFETLMNAAEMQPPQQRHLRLLLQNQLAALRNAKRDDHGHPIKSGRVV